MRYSLVISATILVIGLANTTVTSWAQAENNTVDVITFENGEAKTIQMTKEEAATKYEPIGPAIHLDVNQKEEKSGDTYYSEGINFFQAGEFQKAIDAFLAADKLRPGEPNIYNGLGMAYQKTGDNERALQYFQKALEINPDSSEYLVNLAFYYYDSGQCSLALPYFQKALSLNSQMNGLVRYIEECSKK